jgi:CHAT domain-containing protein/tetratricopeptide (TPR) repeat protein
VNGVRLAALERQASSGAAETTTITALLNAIAEEGDPSDQLHHLLERAATGAPRQVAELLKAEAERQNFIVPRRSMPIANAIETIGTLAKQPSLAGLGAMTAADALREQGHYPEALQEYERAGMLYLSVRDEVGWARTRLGSAYARVVTLELGPALEDADRARSILAGRKLWVRLARLECAVGNLLRELGRTPEALMAHERAARAAEEVVDFEERQLVAAEVHSNQASVYQRLDDYDRAEELLLSATETFRRFRRPGPVAIVQGNLARVLAARGHLSQALALAADVRDTLLSLGRVANAAIFAQVAVECLLELNRPTEALALADESVNQLEASNAGVELAKILLQRAVARERLEHYADAADDLTRAAELFQVGGCQGWEAVVRVQRAQVLERGGDLLEALAVASKASRQLRRRQQVVAAARADVIRAAVLHKLGDSASAGVAARAARAVARRFGVPLLEYQAWRLLGDIAMHDTDERTALHAFARAIDALEKSQGRILTEQRASFLQDKQAVYESAISLCVRAGNARRAFEFAERGKARALLDALALRASGMPLRPRSPAARALNEELATLRRRYDRLSSTLFEPRPQDELGASSVAGQGAVLQQELNECEVRIGVVLDQLRLTGAADVERLALLQGYVHSPLRFLGSATALMQYAIVGNDVCIFVLHPGQPLQVRRVPGAAATVSRVRQMLELNIAAAINLRETSSHTPALATQARTLLQKLHSLLIEPVADLLVGSRRLIVVPHGILHGIPFAALHDGSRYLVEQFELVLAPSASAVTFARQRRARNAGYQTSCRTVVVANSSDGLLPGALAEAEQVATLFDATRLFERDATVENLKQHLQRAMLVHVAAHGSSRPDAPLFSNLRLADGQLTALDCLGLELECELVTLSACETGRASVAAGDEPIGLTRSLLYAGARSVIQSLWRVDDDATRQLMSEMYQRLRQGEGRAHALREAQRAFLRDGTSHGRAHPAFWAAFSLVGDWGALPAPAGAQRLLKLHKMGVAA